MLSASAAQLIYVAAFGALVLGLGGVITTSVVLGTPAASTMAMMGHIVVADAGSTHTGECPADIQCPPQSLKCLDCVTAARPECALVTRELRCDELAISRVTVVAACHNER
jgi:hypothetical protein